MRRDPTNAEAILWQRLRGRALAAFKFRRQFPIGSYIVDFCCISRKLIVELDGDQHAERVRRYDEERTRELARLGFRVIRFWNNEVTDELDTVTDEIIRVLEEQKAQIGRARKSRA